MHFRRCDELIASSSLCFIKVRHFIDGICEMNSASNLQLENDAKQLSTGITEVNMGTTTDAVPAANRARKILSMEKLDYVT